LSRKFLIFLEGRGKIKMRGALTMQLTIDRFENDLAVCESADGSHINILRSFLPEQAREGGIVIWDGGAWALDKQAQQERRAGLYEKQEGLFH